MMTVYHSTVVLSRLMIKKDLSKAKQIAVKCLSDTYMAMSLNKLLNSAAKYRSQVRKIQRYWIDCNKAQMRMFQHFIEVHSGILLTKFIYFGLVRDEFYDRNMPYNLAWKYLQQSSLKISVIMGAYQAKLDEIEDMKNMNL